MGESARRDGGAAAATSERADDRADENADEDDDGDFDDALDASIDRSADEGDDERSRPGLAAVGTRRIATRTDRATTWRT